MLHKTNSPILSFSIDSLLSETPPLQEKRRFSSEFSVGTASVDSAFSQMKLTPERDEAVSSTTNTSSSASNTISPIQVGKFSHFLRF